MAVTYKFRSKGASKAASASVGTNSDKSVSGFGLRSKAADLQAAQQLADKLGVEVEQVQELIGAGFELPDTDTHYRMIVSSSARDKRGKTHWALATTPEPIAFIDMDIGTEGLLNREPFRNRKIIRKSFNLRKRKNLEGEKMTKTEVEEEWHDVSSTLRAVVVNPIIRTLVVDTATDLWELARLAHLGKLTQVLPHHYGPVNKEFSDIIQLAYNRNDLNVVYIHKQKKLYKDDKWKGMYEMQGMSNVPFLVQVNIEHTRSIEDGSFGIRVINCRQNSELDGEELDGPMSTFRNLGRMVFPDSSKADWE